MRVYRAKDYKDMSRKAANIISAQIILKPNSVLGLATGSTPIGTYSQLVDWYKKGDLDFSEVTSVNLDEYKGLPGTNEQSYYYFMHQHLFDQVNIQERHTHLPNGMEPDIMDILDLMSQDRHLRRGHIVWTFRRVLLRQIKDFLLRRRMFQDRHIPWG